MVTTVRFHLRDATTADYDFLFRLNEVTMRDYVVRTFGEWDDAFQARRFRERFDPSKIRVVMVAGRDVGVVEVEATGPEIVLANIRIMADCQGRGLGTTIVTGLLAEARRTGRALRLRVLKVNPARRLYERLGFRVVDETPTAYIMRAPPTP